MKMIFFNYLQIIFFLIAGLLKKLIDSNCQRTNIEGYMSLSIWKMYNEKVCAAPCKTVRVSQQHDKLLTNRKEGLHFNSCLPPQLSLSIFPVHSTKSTTQLGKQAAIT